MSMRFSWYCLIFIVCLGLGFESVAQDGIFSSKNPGSQLAPLSLGGTGTENPLWLDLKKIRYRVEHFQVKENGLEVQLFKRGKQTLLSFEVNKLREDYYTGTLIESESGEVAVRFTFGINRDQKIIIPSLVVHPLFRRQGYAAVVFGLQTLYLIEKGFKDYSYEMRYDFMRADGNYSLAAFSEIYPVERPINTPGVILLPMKASGVYASM